MPCHKLCSILNAKCCLDLCWAQWTTSTCKKQTNKPLSCHYNPFVGFHWSSRFMEYTHSDSQLNNLGLHLPGGFCKRTSPKGLGPRVFSHQKPFAKVKNVGIARLIRLWNCRGFLRFLPHCLDGDIHFRYLLKWVMNTAARIKFPKMWVSPLYVSFQLTKIKDLTSKYHIYGQNEQDN